VTETSPIKGMQHLALEVADTDRAIAFYRDYIGLRLTERHAASEVAAIPVELIFMRVGGRHHDFVLVHNPNKTYRERTPDDATHGPAYFHHFAFECENRDAWLAMMDKANTMDIEIIRGPVIHSPWQKGGEGSWGENESFYVLDPDGHRIEIFCDMATIADDGVFVTHNGERIEAAKVDEL